MCSRTLVNLIFRFDPSWLFLWVTVDVDAAEYFALGVLLLPPIFVLPNIRVKVDDLLSLNIKLFY